MSPPVRFVMQSSEKHSPGWLRLKDHLKSMIIERREMNDGQMTEIQTAKLRGEIQILKEILSFDE